MKRNRGKGGQGAPRRKKKKPSTTRERLAGVAGAAADFPRRCPTCKAKYVSHHYDPCPVDAYACGASYRLDVISAARTGEDPTWQEHAPCPHNTDRN